MIVSFCISTIDQELALKNVQWWNELGGCKGHEVLFGYDKRCYPGTVDAIGIELSKCFDKVHAMPFGADVDGWPEGANYFFRVVTAKLETKPNTRYFMWMEPDAIPLCSGWLDKLDKEYHEARKPFMGDRVQVADIPLHMSGVGFYPLPLHAFSGEAYRAAEIAWDMAGKDQIVPQAHFTRQIEHAWKHPRFTYESELETQIRKEAIVFHSSKDGSLIDLLRSKQGRETLASMPVLPTAQKEPDEPGSPSPAPPFTCDIFIRTYPGDYQWLRFCIESLVKYAKGFRKTWVISPQDFPFPCGHWQPIEWKQMNDECEDGYLSQQITKLYADVITDYQADYIMHIDSDTLLTRPTTPQDFFCMDKLVWPYTPYHAIETPWQPITEKFMTCPVEFEFMRRFPIVLPRWLYGKLREFCHQRHGMTISDYIRNQPPRAFSEFNAFGAYAFRYHRDQFVWQNTLEPHLEALVHARQFHSWSGITNEVQAEIDTILQTTTVRGTGPVDDRPPPPQGIRELPNGIWVIAGEDQISRWVEQEGRLDHDQNSLPSILPLIKEGDTVMDVGAFIGDHTIAYARAVGVKGAVYAFEPNPTAYQCLVHNLKREQASVAFYNVALGDAKQMVPLSGNNGNWGGAYIGEHMKITDVAMMRMDDILPPDIAPDFIKIDVEGSEMKVLSGAQNTIIKHHPTMVIEINREALRRQDEHPENIFQWLRNYGYKWDIMQENACNSSPMFDIICRHNTKSPEVSNQDNGEGGLTRCTSEPPPVTLSIDAAVLYLQEQAAMDAKQRWTVMMALYKAGLTPRNKNKPKKKNEIPVPSVSEETHSPSTAPLSRRPFKGKRTG